MVDWLHPAAGTGWWREKRPGACFPAYARRRPSWQCSGGDLSEHPSSVRRALRDEDTAKMVCVPSGSGGVERAASRDAVGARCLSIGPGLPWSLDQRRALVMCGMVCFAVESGARAQQSIAITGLIRV
jgi:hypothetical protein